MGGICSTKEVKKKLKDVHVRRPTPANVGESAQAVKDYRKEILDQNLKRAAQASNVLLLVFGVDPSLVSRRLSTTNMDTVRLHPRWCFYVMFERGGRCAFQLERNLLERNWLVCLVCLGKLRFDLTQTVCETVC